MANAANPKYHQAIGRRKTSIAKVRLFPGQGPLTVNGKIIAEYFQGLGMTAQKKYQRPFELTKTQGQFTGTIKVFGGGMSSQLDATIHGISRALDKINAETNHTILKRAKLLTRDPRAKERKKYGLAHAARAKKQSPKR